MTKRRSMLFLLDRHIDPSKDEELKNSKIEIESKLPKMVKLVKERRLNRRNQNKEYLLKKESELIELIEDFYNQYQFVYNHYDHLRVQLSHTVNIIKEDDTSSPDSESENDVRNRHTHERIEDLNQNSTHSEYVHVMNKVKASQKILRRFEDDSRGLRERLAEKEQQLSSLAQMHKHRQREATALIKGLELELSSLNLELGSVYNEKKVSEDDKNLRDRASRFDKIEKEMDGTLSPRVNGVPRAQNGFGSEDVIETKRLVAQVSNLKLNVNCLHAHKGNSSMHENLLEQVNKMKGDLGFMRKSNTELETELKKKDRENSNFLNQIEDLKKKLASRVIDVQKMQKEKDELLERVQNVESELHSIRNSRSEIEKQNCQFKSELEEMQEKMSKMLKDRDDQFCVLQNQLEGGKEDKSAHIVALTTQVNHLEQELELKGELEKQTKNQDSDILLIEEKTKLQQRRILELERKLEDRQEQFSNLQHDMSTQIVALTREISQLQRETNVKCKLDEQISSQESEINQLGEERQILQAKILELEINLTEREDEISNLHRRLQIGENEKAGLSTQIDYLERELSSEKEEFEERLTELDYHNNEQKLTIKQQEQAMNKLMQDFKLVKSKFIPVADRKIDEVAEDFRKHFEDNLKILSRRIRVAEEIQTENKDDFNKLKDRCEQNHPGMKSSWKTEFEKISSVINQMMTAMETVVDNFESKEGNFMKRLSIVLDEINVTKNWVRLTIDEMKQSEASPIDEKEHEKVKRLEEKSKKAMGDKLRMIRVTYDLQKKVGELEKVVTEKDEGLLRIREEKMEAIRQLCLWIDYRQSRFDDVKEILLKKRAHGRGRT